MTQTIAQQIKWDFKTNGDLEIKDKNGKRIYYEDSDGNWSKFEWDSKGKVIYYEESNGYWSKREWDSQGNEIYYENSNGKIIDRRPKPCENKEKDLLEERCKYVLKYFFRDYENTMTAKQYNNAMLALRSIALGNPLLKNQ